MKHPLTTGMVFGNGTVVAVQHRNNRRGALLLCSCGKQYWTQASNLYRKPGTVSCGCHKASLARTVRRNIHRPYDASCSITVLTGTD